MMATCFKPNPKCVVFVAGFCFGALLAFLIVSNDGRVRIDSPTLQEQYHIKSLECPEGCNHWLRKSNFRSYKPERQCDIRDFSSKNITRESQLLFQKVKVACIVLYKNDSLHQTYNTWMRTCNNYFFVGSSNDVSSYVNSIVETHDAISWNKLYNLITKHFSLIGNYDWLFFAVDSNMLVIVENLRHLLVGLNPNETHYLGRTTYERGVLFNEAEAGFVLSKAAVGKLKRVFEDKQLIDFTEEKIDFNLGKVFSDLHLPQRSTLDHHGCTRFHSETLEELFEKVQNKEVPCVSNSAVSFSLDNLDNIYFYFYLLHRTRVVNKNDLTCDALPSASITKDDYEWWLFENQDFLGVDPRNISNERFCDLWMKQASIHDQPGLQSSVSLMTLLTGDHKDFAARKILITNQRSKWDEFHSSSYPLSI